jgi:hypothetical protein
LGASQCIPVKSSGINDRGSSEKIVANQGI